MTGPDSFFSAVGTHNLLVLSRERMGCWGLLGLLIVSQWIFPDNSLLSIRKRDEYYEAKMMIWVIFAIYGLYNVIKPMFFFHIKMKPTGEFYHQK